MIFFFGFRVFVFLFVLGLGFRFWILGLGFGVRGLGFGVLVWVQRTHFIGVKLCVLECEVQGGTRSVTPHSTCSRCVELFERTHFWTPPQLALGIALHFWKLPFDFGPKRFVYTG